MPSSSYTTDSTINCTSRLAANGNVQFNPYGEVSTTAATVTTADTTSIGMNTMHIAKNELQSASATLINLIDNEMNNLDEIKRQKLDYRIDFDDTCSNDAFAFNSSLKGKPLKSNHKTATVPCNALK